MNLEKFDSLHNTALSLVEHYHNDMVDKGGSPYINHLVYVSMHCRNKYSKIGGLLHDILEDTACTPEILSKHNIPTLIIDAIQIVSKKEGESYDEFIQRIIDSNNIIALEIKYWDLTNNMDLNRLPNVREKDILRVQKRYLPSRMAIEQKLNELNFSI